MSVTRLHARPSNQGEEEEGGKKKTEGGREAGKRRREGERVLVSRVKVTCVVGPPRHKNHTGSDPTFQLCPPVYTVV